MTDTDNSGQITPRPRLTSKKSVDGDLQKEMSMYDMDYDQNLDYNQLPDVNIEGMSLSLWLLTIKLRHYVVAKKNEAVRLEKEAVEKKLEEERLAKEAELEAQRLAMEKKLQAEK